MNGARHNHLHQELSEYNYLLSAYTQQLATYHAIKSINPITDIEIPKKSERLLDLEKSFQVSA